MKKRKLKIINFLYLTDEKYNKIREYRNQEYIRNMSFNSNIITREEHQNYKILLEKKENHFAYMILNEDKDYSVITLKKEENNSYSVGEYLVDELYKYEGGGIVNRYCMHYLLNKLNIYYIKSEHSIYNKRGYRAGVIAKVKDSHCSNDYLTEYIEILDFNDKKIMNDKARVLFDKVYEIEEVIL